jgi:hypothetical protein
MHRHSRSGRSVSARPGMQLRKTWKQSRDPDFEAKKNRILDL